MATVNYSWNLPTVGGDEDAWGTQLNANWTALDTLLGGTNATEFAILDGATVSTAELNVLDGVTATTAELNVLDGVTATTAELNILDGVTATTAELNQLDGNTFTADVLPNADSTLDLGSSSAAWAIAYLDAIEPVGADTTIKRVGGTNATPIVEGIAKVWVNFNGTGTIAARDSFNLSSLVDNGTGDYTANFSNAFGAADYLPTTLVANDGISDVVRTATSSGGFLAGSFRYSQTNPAGTAADTLFCGVLAHGDLA